LIKKAKIGVSTERAALYYDYYSLIEDIKKKDRAS
jgi:hypothetical protein